MGVMQRLAKLFGGSSKTQTTKPTDDRAATGPTGPGSASRSRSNANGAASAMDRKPVNIDVYLDDDAEGELEASMARELVDADASEETPGTARPIEPETASRTPIVSPRNRQELIKELQKNYTEVLGLVRKVDDHLDTQSHRSERLLELAERSARNMDALPDLVEQNRRVADALGDLIELTRDARTRNDAAVDRLNKTAIEQLEAGQRQTAALQSMQSAIHRSGEAEAEMARSIGGFNETLSDMSSSARDLGDTISQMRETDAEREAELAKLVSSGQKWLIAAVVLCALMAVVVVGLVVNGVV